jgi:hypothetical protein
VVPNKRQDAAFRCFDDVGFAFDASGGSSLQDTEAVRGGGGREKCGSCWRRASHPKVLQHASIIKTNTAPFCTKARTCNLPKLPDITRDKQSAFQLDAVREGLSEFSSGVSSGPL